MNESSPTARQFRGSRLDHALGNSLALLAVVVPPCLYGMSGLILSLVFVNLFLVLSLLRNPDRPMQELITNEAPGEPDRSFQQPFSRSTQ